MNSREIALIIIFVALTIALDPLRIPSMYLIGSYYRFCEIPIVAAFLLFGPKVGISVAVLNLAAETMIYPAQAGVTVGRPFVLLLTLSMLLGLCLAQKFLKWRKLQGKASGKQTGLYFTVFGALIRTASAPIVLFPFYRYVLPLVWISFSDMQVIALMPLLMFYALTFSLYTIPIGYLIARTVSRNLKIGNQL